MTPSDYIAMAALALSGAGVLGQFLNYLLKQQIRAELASSTEKLLDALKTEYQSIPVCSARMEGMESRLRHLEDIPNPAP